MDLIPARYGDTYGTWTGKVHRKNRFPDHTALAVRTDPEVQCWATVREEPWGSDSLPHLLLPVE